MPPYNRSITSVFSTPQEYRYVLVKKLICVDPSVYSEVYHYIFQIKPQIVFACNDQFLIQSSDDIPDVAR